VVPPPAIPTKPVFDPTQLDPNSVAFKTWTNPPGVLPERSWTEGWRRADIGAANGHGNARSLARLQSAVACGGEVDGVRLLSPKTIDRIFEVQSNGVDLVIGIPSKRGVGYSLFPEGRVCAFGGTGGSLVVIDADRRMTFAYVMNKMGGGTIAAALAQRVQDIVNR
jgi:CubicO group peptidase (beta-lactamase class C family)